MNSGRPPASKLIHTRFEGRRLVRWLPAALAVGAMLLLTLGTGPAVLADPLTPLTVSFTADNHVYDGVDTTTVSGCEITGGVDPLHSDVSCDFSNAVGTFDAGKDVGTGLAVTGSGFVPGGSDAALYTIETVAPSTANITQAPLTVTATGDNKVYDGTPVASVTLSDNHFGTDALTLGYASASFNAGKNVGNGKAISVSGITVTGTDAPNYTFNATATTSANITQAPLTVTATNNIKVANGCVAAAPLCPNGSPDGLDAAALPAISALTPLATGDTAVGLQEKYLDPTANVNKTLRPFGTVTDGNGGHNYAYTFVDTTTGEIRPAPVASVQFTTQPIDTQVNTTLVPSPIYSACLPPASGASPCATAPTSTPIKVTARDAFGNLAGRGAPGAAFGSGVTLPTAEVTVTINETNSAGTALSGLGVAAVNGVASFDDILKISVTRASTKLFASAGSGAPDTSANFQVVSDLAACDGTTCDNLATGGASGLPQKAFGRIKTTGDFYVPTANQSVILTTQFSGFQQGMCATPSSTVGQTSEVRVQGTGVTPTSPNFSVTLIYPKDTIKKLGLTARNADSYEVCLGATWLGAGTPTASQVWWAENLKTGKLQPAVVDPANPKLYWGWVPACSVVNASTTLTSAQKLANPCATLKTKQVATLRAELVTKQGMSATDFNALGARDADIMIVISKPWPWDGKFGTGLS